MNSNKVVGGVSGFVLTNLANDTDHDDRIDVTNLIAFSLEDTKSPGSTVRTEESANKPHENIES
jgi:hypothetical protein